MKLHRYQFLSAALLMIAGVAYADTPLPTLQSAKVHLSTETLSGYILVEDGMKAQVGSPEFLAEMRPHKFLRMLFKLVSIQYPKEAIASVGPGLRAIPVEEIRRIEKASGPFDGRVPDPSIISVSERAAKLLQKEPTAWCNTPAYEAYEEYWVSYNPKITAKKLKPFCFEDMENKPSDKAVSQMLQNKDVFRFGFPAY